MAVNSTQVNSLIVQSLPPTNQFQLIALSLLAVHTSRRHSVLASKKPTKDASRSLKMSRSSSSCYALYDPDDEEALEDSIEQLDIDDTIILLEAADK